MCRVCNLICIKCFPVCVRYKNAMRQPILYWGMGVSIIAVALVACDIQHHTPRQSYWYRYDYRQARPTMAFYPPTPKFSTLEYEAMRAFHEANPERHPAPPLPMDDFDEPYLAPATGKRIPFGSCDSEDIINFSCK